MEGNDRKQLDHFAAIDHALRYDWQTSDPFVCAREYVTLRPLVDVLRKAHMGEDPVTVLESGCGEGVNFKHLQQLGFTDSSSYTFTGIDPSPEAVAEARKHDVDARVGDGLSLPFANESFDVVFSRDVLHHLVSDRERKRFHEEMIRVTKSGGSVVSIEPEASSFSIIGLALVVPAERGLLHIRESRISQLLTGACITRLCPSSVWRFVWHYRSPLRHIPLCKQMVAFFLRVYEAGCARFIPDRFWSYRAYVWKKERRSV